MVLQAFQRLSKEEDGQALVLAALLMLAIALAVLSVSSLGRTIHDEIRLQNAADSAAHTLAAQEARAFNFYAFANRAQIAHYVGILQILSVDAIALGITSAMGTFGGLLKTAGSVCSGVTGTACGLIPVVGPLLEAFSRIADATERVLRAAARTLIALDALVGRVAVPLLVGANLALFASQASMLASSLGRMRDEELLRIARATAPDAQLAFGIGPSAQNARRFLDVHFKEAMTLWGTGDRADGGIEDGTTGRKNYARRGMSELVHASRHGALVYDRSFPEKGLALGSMPGLSQVAELFSQLSGLRLRGHTRLLSTPDAELPPSRARTTYEQMEKPGYSTARYPTGNAIGANFYLKGKVLPSHVAEPLGIDRKEMGSVTSTGGATRGFACTWNPDDPYDRLPLGIITLHAPKFSCEINRGKHPWWGITPFMHFDASPAGCDSAENEFCQPDVWVALRSGSASEATERETRILRAAGSEASFSKGSKVAVARALAYYHRPGSWKEPPNFFNPHWRAKLAPVEPGLRRLAEEMGPTALSVALGSALEEGGTP